MHKHTRLRRLLCHRMTRPSSWKSCVLPKSKTLHKPRLSFVFTSSAFGVSCCWITLQPFQPCSLLESFPVVAVDCFVICHPSLVLCVPRVFQLSSMFVFNTSNCLSHTSSLRQWPVFPYATIQSDFTISSVLVYPYLTLFDEIPHTASVIFVARSFSLYPTHRLLCSVERCRTLSWCLDVYELLRTNRRSFIDV